MAGVDFNKNIISILDIGTSKICCMITQVGKGGSFELIGLGYNVSKGISKGCISNITEAGESIAKAVEAAEKQAGIRINNIYINFSGVGIFSNIISASINLGTKPISQNDIKKVIDKGIDKCNYGDRERLHCIPISYSIDDEHKIEDPRGMYGNTLGIKIHTITSHPTPITNLKSVIRKCHLDISGIIVSPYASGVSCLVEDEKQLGSIVIDIGGGTTGVSIFYGGHPVYAFSLPVGGDNISRDIAHAFTTSLSTAERLKNLEGCALLTQSDNDKYIKVNPLGELDNNNSQSISRAELNKVIIARVQEIFKIINFELKKTGFSEMSGSRIVLTGGGSLLQEIKEQATFFFNKPVRLGRPEIIKGLEHEMARAAHYSGIIGVLKIATDQHLLYKNYKFTSAEKNPSKLFKLGQWIVQNL